MALWNYCAICGKRIEAGDPCLGVEKKNAETAGDSICFDCVKIENINGLCKTVSITDLLARADAAEARVRALETSFRTEKCENGPECVELGRVRKALAEAEARAEKAERERDAAISVLQNLRDSALTAISEYEKNQKQKYGQKEE